MQHMGRRSSEPKRMPALDAVEERSRNALDALVSALRLTDDEVAERTGIKRQGVQLGTTTAIAQNVEPDQTALWESPTATEAVEGFTCRVVDVDRNASL